MPSTRIEIKCACVYIYIYMHIHIHVIYDCCDKYFLSEIYIGLKQKNVLVRIGFVLRQETGLSKEA